MNPLRTGRFAVNAGREYPIHSFDVPLSEAKKIQGELRKKVSLCDTVKAGDIRIAGGVDTAFIKTPFVPSCVSARNRAGFSEITDTSGRIPYDAARSETEQTALAAVVVVDVPEGNIIETAYAAAPVYFPYIPGYLSFREGPAVLAAVGELKTLPEVMIYDGCGIAHPRGFGLASHMAVLTGIPSVGCAKSRLCGFCKEPQPEKGSWTYLYYKNETVGACLRTRTGVHPVFVSPGSGFSVDSARELVMACVGKYRLPEPTRLAHSVVTAKKKDLVRSSVSLKTTKE